MPAYSRHPRRRIMLERLDDRIVLDGTGDVVLGGGSPYLNPLQSTDINNDGDTELADALAGVNAIHNYNAGVLADKFAPPSFGNRGASAAGADVGFVDTNGDGLLDLDDVLNIVRTIHNGIDDTQPPIPVDDTVGDTTETATPLTFESGHVHVKSYLNAAADVDVFSMTAEKNRLSVAGISTFPNQLRVQILDAQLQTLADTRPAGQADGALGLLEGWTDTLDIPVVAGETYYIIVSATDGTATGKYYMDVLNYDADWWRPEADSALGDDQHGDTLDSSASELSFGAVNSVQINSHVDTDGDVDVFRFAADETLLIAALIGIDADLDVRLSLYDVSGALLVSRTSDSLLGFGALLTSPLTVGETYYLSVSAEAGQAGQYLLDVNQTHVYLPPIPAEDTIGDTPQTALPLTFEDGYVFAMDYLNTAGDVDVLQITPEEDLLVLTAISTFPSQLRVQVLNSALQPVADTDSLGDGQLFYTLDVSVLTGENYYIVVSAKDDTAIGEYRIDLLNFDSGLGGPT